jgi:poly(3-hydroxybutyrate) depolymerase
MNARMQDANTNMRAIGEREGYVVVQPNGGGTPPSVFWIPAADYDKVWTFFELALKTFAIDPKRVHMTGFSQGGRMTWSFLCKHADVVASAAPAAEAGCTEAEARAAKREVPVLYMHGRNDTVINSTSPPSRSGMAS